MKIDNFLALQESYAPPKVEIKDSDDAKLKEQTDKFEAFFIKKVLDISMEKSNSLFPEDAGEKIYNSMYNDAMSDAMTGKFGFSELLFNFLKERY